MLTWHAKLFNAIDINIYFKVVDRTNTLLKFCYFSRKCYQRRNHRNILPQIIRNIFVFVHERINMWVLLPIVTHFALKSNEWDTPLPSYFYFYWLITFDTHFCWNKKTNTWVNYHSKTWYYVIWPNQYHVTNLYKFLAIMKLSIW